MGEFEDMWLVFRCVMDPNDFSPQIKFKWLLRDEPTNVRRSDDLNFTEQEAVQVSIPKWAAKSDIDLAGHDFALEALRACSRQYKSVSALFMNEIWPAVMDELRTTQSYKREQFARDHIYCIIDQGSRAMSMDKPSLVYLGDDFDAMWQKVEEYVAQFKEKCFRKSMNKYIRPDHDDVCSSWTDVMMSLFDTLVENNKLIIDDQEWDDDAEPGFFCVYAKAVREEK